jgi:hypothetical protein
LYAEPKVLIAKMAKRCEAFFDSEGQYAGLNINCVARPTGDLPLDFICAYCNSRVFMFFYNQLFGALRMSGGYYQFQAPQLRSMPVPTVSPAQVLQIVQLVKRASASYEKDAAAGAQAIIQEIDHRFGELFGLSDDEFLMITPEGD